MNPIPQIEEVNQIQNLTAYHAQYYAYELTKRSAADTVEKLAASLSGAQVDLNPHQIEAALFAFQSPLSKGALLADEVGLGKTIEAGLVIAQHWAEQRRKILIIVPANLRNQWNQELLDKFFLPSILLESQSFNQQIKQGNLNPFQQKEIIICSYQFARAKETYLQQIHWDLVVIDEAHRLRNVYKTSNKIANAIKNAVSNARKKILLTATPLQNSLLELYGLVSIIDDFTFGDIKSYKSQFSKLTGDDSFEDLKERLKPVCKRTLRKQVLEYISYTNRIPLTQEFIPSAEEQKLYNLVSGYLESPSLYALPSGQRQLMTLILRKLLASSTYAITDTLKALANKLDDTLKKQAIQTEANFQDHFEGFDALKDEWDAEYEPQNSLEGRIFSDEEKREIAQELSILREFEALARSIQKNSKGEVLLTALERGFTEAERHKAPKKAIIFTESTRTQTYLKEILESTQYRGQVVLFNGTNADPESRVIYQEWLEKYKGTDKISGSKTADVRAALVDRFRNQATIMIATEAAAEGINLQFCSLVVNYDLPWNPQRIEQRIGRCHRYGQKYDVVVVNFLNTENAADRRVHELLEQKFQLFSGVFGASDEVLGVVESGISFEKRIAEIYQNHWRSKSAIQQAFNQLQLDLESQIDEKLKQTRQKLLENFDEEVHEKLRLRHAESKEYLGKYEAWLWELTRFHLKPYAQFNPDAHAFTLLENPFPEKTIHPGPYRMGKSAEEAQVYRLGHPLAQQIIGRCKETELAAVTLAFDYTGTPHKKISILEGLIGQSGWLSLTNLTIQTLDAEDHIALCAVRDDGQTLSDDQCRRLFSLPAGVEALNRPAPEAITTELEALQHRFEAGVVETISKENVKIFDREIDKLDKWAEDVKSSLQLALNELDKNIRTEKTEAKKLLNLEEKVKVQRQIKEMEKKRNKMRLDLFQAQDDVDNQKEALIADTEARLRQKIERTPLFTVRWRVI